MGFKMFLGVDGGGSGTTACVMREDGLFMGLGAGGPSSLYYTEADVLARSVAQAADQALARAQVAPEKICHTCVALSGAGRESDAQRASGILERVFPGGRLSVVEDSLAALAAACEGEDGIVVIAGTGSNCVGVSGGILARAGGWGALLGDEGSAYSIAIQGFRAAAKAADGRQAATALLDALLRALGGTHPQDLIPMTHGLDRTALASFAPVVFDCADQGDKTARAILRVQAGELASMAVSVATQLGFDGPRVGLAGGCFQNRSYMRATERAIQVAFLSRGIGDTPQVFRVTRSPAEGAAILAQRMYRYHRVCPETDCGRKVRR